jgi:hypothetical protein
MATKEQLEQWRKDPYVNNLTGEPIKRNPKNNYVPGTYRLPEGFGRDSYRPQEGASKHGITIDDGLWFRAQQLSKRRKITLRSILEDALQEYLKDKIE